MRARTGRRPRTRARGDVAAEGRRGLRLGTCAARSASPEEGSRDAVLARRVWAGRWSWPARGRAPPAGGGGLVVFTIQSLGWPFAPGRDLESYLGVYVDFWHTDAVFPWEMLSRTPVTPLVVGGLLDLGSPFSSSRLGAALRGLDPALREDGASSSAAALRCSCRVALAAIPGYGIVFHELGQRIVFARRLRRLDGGSSCAPHSSRRPGFARRGRDGAHRADPPANQVFLVVAILPLVFPAPGACASVGPRRSAGRRRAARLVGRDRPLALRRSRRLARRTAILPFFRTFIVDHAVRPENGPRIAGARRAVERGPCSRRSPIPVRDRLATFSAGSRASMRTDQPLDRLWAELRLGVSWGAPAPGRARPPGPSLAPCSATSEGALAASSSRPRGPPPSDTARPRPRRPAAGATVVVDGRSSRSDPGRPIPPSTRARSCSTPTRHRRS